MQKIISRWFVNFWFWNFSPGLDFWPVLNRPMEGCNFGHFEYLLNHYNMDLAIGQKTFQISQMLNDFNSFIRRNFNDIRHRFFNQIGIAIIDKYSWDIWKNQDFIVYLELRLIVWNSFINLSCFVRSFEFPGIISRNRVASQHGVWNIF